MRKSTLACLMIVALSFAFGCKKDKTETAPEVKSGLSFKFDGNVWTAIGANGTYFSAENIIMIMATNSTAQGVSISLIGGDVGSYDIYGDDYDYNAAVILGANEMDTYSTLSLDEHILVGKVVISENDKTNHTLSGTFYFDGYNSNYVKKSFTEGKFTKVAYIVASGK
jgi:hypothetical protein